LSAPKHLGSSPNHHQLRAFRNHRGSGLFVRERARRCQALSWRYKRHPVARIELLNAAQVVLNAIEIVVAGTPLLLLDSMAAKRSREQSKNFGEIAKDAAAASSPGHKPEIAQTLAGAARRLWREPCVRCGRGGDGRVRADSRLAMRDRDRSGLKRLNLSRRLSAMSATAISMLVACDVDDRDEWRAARTSCIAWCNARRRWAHLHGEHGIGRASKIPQAELGPEHRGDARTEAGARPQNIFNPGKILPRVACTQTDALPRKTGTGRNRSSGGTAPERGGVDSPPLGFHASIAIA